MTIKCTLNFKNSDADIQQYFVDILFDWVEWLYVC